MRVLLPALHFTLLFHRALSTCMECKSVSGDGPLAGDYILVDTQESGCGDGCAYNRIGEDEENKYCFVKEDGLYTVDSCEQVVPSTEAPRMEIIRHIIEEDGEIYEQVDSYNNETGEVVINVPSHGDREPVNIVLDPNTRTLVASTEGKCQIKKVPEDIDPYSIVSSKDEVESREDAVTGDMEEIKHSITLETEEAFPENVDQLSNAAHAECVGKKVVMTEEVEVSESDFSNLTQGGVMKINRRYYGRNRRKRSPNNCTIQTMCGARSSGCWRWPYGTSFSIHHLNLDVLCVDCCEEEDATDTDLCACSSITTLQKLEQCTLPKGGECPDGFFYCDGECKVEVGAPTQMCNGSCPESREMCGDQCIPKEWSSSLYDHYKQWFDCNGQCIRGNTPCNGSCPEGMTACGNRCVRDQYVDFWYKTCNGQCITKNTPCNGECEEGQILCGDICRADNGHWRDCDGNCIHKTQACDGDCPLGSLLCGNSSRCILPDDRSFKECNGECIPFLKPCNNICPEGTVSCGDECLPPGRAKYFKECDGKCIYYMTPCNGQCGDRLIFCPQNNETKEEIGYGYGNSLGNSCVWDDGSTYFCGDYCKRKDEACDGVCRDGRVPCGNISSSEPDVFHKCTDDDSINEYYKDCDGQCIYHSTPCNGECPEGWRYCSAYNGYCSKNTWQCNNTCPQGWEKCGNIQCMRNDSQDSINWSCGDRCYEKNVPCNGVCADGWLPCGNWTTGYKTCYNPSSSIQSCNGQCLRNGTACDGQCPEGFNLCTIGHTGYNNEQVCYNDSDLSLFYKYNGFCWWKYNGYEAYKKMIMSNLEIDNL